MSVLTPIRAHRRQCAVFPARPCGPAGPYGRLTARRQWNVLFDVVTSTLRFIPYYSVHMEAYKPGLGMAMDAHQHR